MELQDCVIAKSLITEVECNLLPTRYRAINLQYLLARERNVIQNSICWVGGRRWTSLPRGKTSSAALTLTVVSWNRDSIYVLGAIPKDPKAPSKLHAASTREARLLRGQGVAAGTLSVKEGRGYCSLHIWPTPHSCNMSPRIMWTQNLGASPTAGVS